MTLRGAGHDFPSTPCRPQRELITNAAHSRHEDCYAWPNGLVAVLIRDACVAKHRQVVSLVTTGQHHYARNYRFKWADWRNKKLPEIRANATRLASQMNDKQLHKRVMTCEDLIRMYELLMRNDESVGTGRSLVACMDIRGLDLRQVRGLHQDQIHQAQGDSETQLPTYLKKPPNWG